MADSGHYYISDASLVGPKLFDMLDSIRKYEIISEGGDLVGALIDIDIAQVTLIFLPKEKTKTLITGLKNVVRDAGCANAAMQDYTFQRIRHVRYIMECIVEPEFDENGIVQDFLLTLNSRLNGLLHVWNSLFDFDREILAGVLRGK
jgi:hypothetical protein